MADVAVVTDSTACLPPALADSAGIAVVSLYYDVYGAASPTGGHEIPGRGERESDFDGDLGRFFADLDASKTVATTSPPTIEDFVGTYERLLQQHSAVVAIMLATSLSPTCALAREAAEQVESKGRGSGRVVVIDSAGGAGHLGMQALAAGHAAARGADLEGVIERTLKARKEVRQWFVLDTLEYLKRGGRIGTAAAWIGSALDLKPILMVESELKAVERVRTRKRAIERLIELMRQRRAVGADRWFVQHTYAHEDAQMLVDRLGAVFDAPPEFVSELGPVLATHLGPGMLSAGGLPGAALEGAYG
ncbi:DegV family protein [Mycobacterium sp. 94-17]|uniref:DegV family protein n=1 Tax=Mycobacterium sp. 94-17 TaxID=2986147 RepID=UPI002D1F03BF|nr:DegV family protein [Mycobacterium sp. 94-17]MEB4210630.1 DegV family protein [Mycobacterium sp. 94-17]